MLPNLTITKSNRHGSAAVIAVTLRKEVETLMTARMHERQHAIQRAEAASEWGKESILTLASTKVGLPHGDIGILWGELNELDDALASAKA